MTFNNTFRNIPLPDVFTMMNLAINEVFSLIFRFFTQFLQNLERDSNDMLWLKIAEKLMKSRDYRANSESETVGEVAKSLRTRFDSWISTRFSNTFLRENCLPTMEQILQKWSKGHKEKTGLVKQTGKSATWCVSFLPCRLMDRLSTGFLNSVKEELYIAFSKRLSRIG